MLEGYERELLVGLQSFDVLYSFTCRHGCSRRVFDLDQQDAFCLFDDKIHQRHTVGSCPILRIKTCDIPNTRKGEFQCTFLHCHTCCPTSSARATSRSYRSMNVSAMAFGWMSR